LALTPGGYTLPSLLPIRPPASTNTPTRSPVLLFLLGIPDPCRATKSPSRHGPPENHPSDSPTLKAARACSREYHPVCTEGRSSANSRQYVTRAGKIRSRRVEESRGLLTEGRKDARGVADQISNQDRPVYRTEGWRRDSATGTVFRNCQRWPISESRRPLRRRDSSGLFLRGLQLEYRNATKISKVP